MADPKLKRSENVPGAYYVDDTCISCAACWTEAPEHFLSHALHTYAYVVRQPSTKSEAKRCATAMKLCPVGAIGQGKGE